MNLLKCCLATRSNLNKQTPVIRHSFTLCNVLVWNDLNHILLQSPVYGRFWAIVLGYFQTSLVWFIWGDLNTAVVLWCGPKQPHWDPSEVFVTNKLWSDLFRVGMLSDLHLIQAHFILESRWQKELLAASRRMNQGLTRTSNKAHPFLIFGQIGPSLGQSSCVYFLEKIR